MLYGYHISNISNAKIVPLFYFTLKGVGGGGGGGGGGGFTTEILENTISR